MAFGKKSRFAGFVTRREHFDAFIEYMSDENAYEEELQELLSGRHAEAAEAFANYRDVLNQFRVHTLHGEFEEAKACVKAYGDENEMGMPEIKSVLDDLADKTGDYHCYELYWEMAGEDTVAEHEYAANMLINSLPDCDQSSAEALKHIQWLLDETDKPKEQLQYAEMALGMFGKPHSTMTAMEAAEMVALVRSLNPKSKLAGQVEMKIYQQDAAALQKVRPLLADGKQEEALALLLEQGQDIARRALFRGACENKADCGLFVNALFTLQQRTKDPMDAFYAASSVWNCDMRKDEDALARSMEIGLWSVEHIERNENYVLTLLDALYLIDPYPLPDDKAVALANSVLERYPENEIALECIAIAKEQQGESGKEGEDA